MASTEGQRAAERERRAHTARDRAALSCERSRFGQPARLDHPAEIPGPKLQVGGPRIPGGPGVLLFGFASSWVVGVFGFAIMLVSTIVLTHNLRRMGQHGFRQLSASLRGRNLNEAIDDAARRFRRRLGGDES